MSSAAGDDHTNGHGARRAAALGLVGAGATAIAALGLGALALSTLDRGPLFIDLGPAPALVAAVLTAALVGGIGAVSQHRDLLLAAGIALSGLSLISFSGVTLILLVPAVAFMFATGRPESGATPERPSPVPGARRLGQRLAVFLAALAMVIAAYAVLFVFGLVLLVAGAAVAVAVRRGPRPSIRGLFLGGFIVALIWSGIAVALASTETVCWREIATDSGVVHEVVPDTGTLHLGGGVRAAGCSSGVLTSGGIGAGAVLLIGAVAISLLAAGGAKKNRPRLGGAGLTQSGVCRPSWARRPCSRGR